MKEYKEELENEDSDYYRLFRIFSEVNNNDAYKIFYIFFINIHRGVFAITDYFNYIQNNGLDITYISIVKFLAGAKNEKINIIYNRLLNSIYENYGNLEIFIEGLFSDSENTTFLRVQEDDILFKDPKIFILKPNINYLDTTAYRNKIIAEKNY